MHLHTRMKTNPDTERIRVFCFSILFFLIIFSSTVFALPLIRLNGTGEVHVSAPNHLDGFSKATWNLWVKQDAYTPNAGLVGKYVPRKDYRSYIIRTSLTNGTSIILSSDGVNAKGYTSFSKKACGIRKNDVWTMITVTYNGSVIQYYRNGFLCDQDTTNISPVYTSLSPVRLGAGNALFFRGAIDEFTLFHERLSREQILRLYNESRHGSALGQSIPVLVYHRIESPIDQAIKTNPQEFSKQMAYLKEHHFTPITLREYHLWRKGNFTLPEKPIILVFDDGWKSVYTIAKPILDQYGFVGSVAVVINYANGIAGAPEYMLWSQLKNLSKQGWSIESHGVTHAHMLTLSETAFRAHLLGAKNNITKNIGIAPSSFVFPFHEANTGYTSICAEYYSLCWTQGSLHPSYNFYSTPGERYLSLRRINVVNTTTMNDVASFLGRDTNISAEWTMDEGAGDTTTDLSGNKNIASLLKGAFWEDDGILVPTHHDGSYSFFPLSLSTIKQAIISLQKEQNEPIAVSNDAAAVVRKKTGAFPDNMQIEEDAYYSENRTNP